MLTLSYTPVCWKNMTPFSNDVETNQLLPKNVNMNSQLSPKQERYDLMLADVTYGSYPVTDQREDVKKTSLPDILTTFQQNSTNLRVKMEQREEELKEEGKSPLGEAEEDVDWEESKRTFTTLTVAKDKLLRYENTQDAFLKPSTNIRHATYFPPSTTEEDIRYYHDNIANCDVLQETCNEVFKTSDITQFLNEHQAEFSSPLSDVSNGNETYSMYSPVSTDPSSSGRLKQAITNEQQPTFNTNVVFENPQYKNTQQHYSVHRQLSEPTQQPSSFIANAVNEDGKLMLNPHQENPFAHFESFLGEGNLTSEVKQVSRIGKHKDVELSTVIDYIVNDIRAACHNLQLNTDPQTWSTTQVQKWVEWAVNYNLLTPLDLSSFNFTGNVLCKMSKCEMLRRAPRHGDILHAYLEIWQAVVENSSKPNPKDTQNRKRRGGVSDDVPDSKKTKLPNGDGDGPHNQKQSTSPTNNSAINCMTPNHTAGIHLWQFLKELLLQPQAYGQFIRWVDKEKGVFKIEDSVEVARLWGIRKNRPAMNYDKLSRSIRQYYKKGIIKKTTVSQRLVYQFVEPLKCIL